MALRSLLLPLLLLVSFGASATQPPRTLHVPVVHRDAVSPPAPGASPGGLLLRRHGADAGHYTVQLASLHPTAASAETRMNTGNVHGFISASGRYSGSSAVP